MFADQYIVKNKVERLLQGVADNNTGIIVVIPCLREPAVLETLYTLERCFLPEASVEVIVLINHSETASDETKAFNRKTKQALDEWSSSANKPGLTFWAIGPVELRKKWAGAGLARKKGMDEAVVRFNAIGRKKGIIVSLDADTLVEPNYLIEIEKHFKANPKEVGATISFRHQTDNLGQKHRQGILLYEQYLGYYKRALDFAGYPHSMFTVGSAFAVTAQAYVKRGGMNRRQAGEDFYFLQNLVQIGPVGEILTTTVHPSARLSDRVPFGTGPIVKKWLNDEENLTLTYNFDAFCALKAFFGRLADFYLVDESGFKTIIAELPQSVASFLIHDEFWNDVVDLNANCTSLAAFKKRFFQKFNAFRILKFLNFSHDGYYERASVERQCLKLSDAGY